MDGSRTDAHPTAAEDVPGEPDRNITLMLLGCAVAMLAPLGGFLGGSIIGSSPGESVDPMFLWLFIGLVVGGLGALVAVFYGLRWFHLNRESF